MQLPLNVSPVSASFFGLMRQGIHPVLCVACSYLFVLHVFIARPGMTPALTWRSSASTLGDSSLNKIEVRYNHSVGKVQVREDPNR
jgi:non-ribosomal peptide synthetase component E (peptide arylation enzyme)